MYFVILQPMNPREIIMTDKEVKHLNFAGISNKIEDVANSPVEEKVNPHFSTKEIRASVFKIGI